MTNDNTTPRTMIVELGEMYNPVTLETIAASCDEHRALLKRTFPNGVSAADRRAFIDALDAFQQCAFHLRRVVALANPED